MSKRSGFAVTIKAWIDADPNNAGSMVVAAERVNDLKIDMANLKFTVVKISSKFMLSALVIPDEPKAAQAVVTAVQVQDGKRPVAHLSDGTTKELEDFPPIPPQFDRRKA